MASYYFRRISDGEKVVERTLAAINKRAKLEATKFGQAVQVYVDKAERGVGMRSHRQMSMARNPVKESAYEFVHEYAGDMRRGTLSFDNARYAKFYAEELVRLYERPVKWRKIGSKVWKTERTKSFSRNPIDFSPPEYSSFRERGDARDGEISRARKPKRMAVHSRRGWMGGKAAPKAKATYEVRAPELKLREPATTLEEAKRIAKALAKQGYTSEIHSV